MKKLLVLAAGPLQVPIIKKARDMGIYVIAIDGNSQAVGLKLAQKAIVANILSENDILKIAQDERIDGVIHPCSEVSMHVMGRINDVMGLCGISYQMAKFATNKHLMRESFEQYGASSPKSYIVDNYSFAWELFCRNFKSDAIIKPSRNSGSRGISKVEKSISCNDFKVLYDRAYNESLDKSVLIEEFVDGPEFSVEIIVWNQQVYVLAITDKKTTGAPYFVELGHNQPSIYSSNIIEKVKNVAIDGVKALQLNNCAVHAELKVHADEAYIIEIGARLGGDFISTELVHLSTGIDMVSAAINVALGQSPYLKPQTNPQGVCIRYFCPKPGLLKKIHNLDLLNNEHIYDAQIYCKEGDIIPEVVSSLSRSGHIIVVDEDVNQAIKLADMLVNNIYFETI